MPTEFCLTTEFNYDDYGVRLRSPIFLQKADYGLTTDLFLPVIFYYTLFLTPPLECSTQSRKRHRRGMPPGFVNGEPHLEPIPPPRPGDVELAAAGDKAAKMRMAKWRKRDMIRKRTIAQQQGRIAARMKSPARAPSPPLDDDNGKKLRCCKYRCRGEIAVLLLVLLSVSSSDGSSVFSLDGGLEYVRIAGCCC